MLVGSEKVLEKRFDGPGKVWNFLSLKVLEPSFIYATCHERIRGA